MSKIYIVRHGETEWNKENRSQGCSNDIPLSKTGKAQADLVAKRLADERIDMFFSSTLKRAFETANIIAENHGKNVEKCSDFMEFRMGCWEGLTYKDIVNKYPEVFNVWSTSPHLAQIPDAETLVELRERSVNKLMEIIRNNEDKNILVVSHGITTKVIICALMGIDISNLHKIRQDNTAINIFEYKDGSFQTLLLNDTCHLKDFNMAEHTIL